MKHIHIDKAIGGTNDGEVTPYIGNQPVLSMVKKREPLIDPWFEREHPMIESRFEVEHYRLEHFQAEDTLISFWVEESLSPATALCQMLLRYTPKEDAVEVG